METVNIQCEKFTQLLNVSYAQMLITFLSAWSLQI